MAERDDKPVVIIERSEGGVGVFLVGIALGAGLALLYAPRSGEETRQELKNQGRRLRVTAAEKAEELQELLSGGYEEAKSRVEDGIATARQKIGEKTVDAKEAVEVGKEAVHSAREELERRLSDARTSRGKGTRKKATAKAAADDAEVDE